MTPQLQQAIRLLQLPVLELQAQIREALETNVMLEPEDEAGSLETGDRRRAAVRISTATSGLDRVERRASDREAGPDVDLIDDPDWSDSQVTGPVRVAVVGRRRSIAGLFRRARRNAAGTSDLAAGDVAAERARHAHRRRDHRRDQRRRLRHRAARGDRAQPAAGNRRDDRRSRAHAQARAGDGSGRRRRALGQ